MQVRTVRFASTDAARNLAQSLHHTGFGVVVDHPIAANRIEAIYQAWGAFFKDKKKHDYLRDPEKQDGYFPFKSENAKGIEQKDLKEFYHVYPWGRVPPELETLTRDLYDDLLAIGLHLLQWLDMQSPPEVRQGFSLPLSEMMAGSQQSLLRVLHYPPLAPNEEKGAVRAAAHEDINLITLLLSGSQPGLQAQDNSGAWHDIPCDAGAITVNNGDMLAMASADYYPSTRHRVINPDRDHNRSRYSIPMFLHPKGEVRLRDDVTADMSLQMRLQEIGLR